VRTLSFHQYDDESKDAQKAAARGGLGKTFFEALALALTK
jgi:hypothetical protein